MTRLIAVLTLFAFQSVSTSPSVVFVCEHGAAKSVIATAYFQQARGRTRAAVSSDIPWTSPQDELSVRAVADLREDGIAVPSGKPAAISDGRRDRAACHGASRRSSRTP